MIYVAWDDNEGYWTVQEGGSIPVEGQTWVEATVLLLDKYSQPGDDDWSIEMHRALLEE